MPISPDDIDAILDAGWSPRTTAKALMAKASGRRVKVPTRSRSRRMGFRVSGHDRWFATQEDAKASGLPGRIIDVTRKGKGKAGGGSGGGKGKKPASARATAPSPAGQDRHQGKKDRSFKRTTNDSVGAANRALDRYREVYSAAAGRGDDWRPFEMPLRDGRRLRVSAERPANVPTDRAMTEGMITFQPDGGADLRVVSPSRFGDGRESIRPDFVLGHERETTLHELVHLDDQELDDEQDHRQAYLASAAPLDVSRDRSEIERLYRRQPFEVRANERAVIAAMIDDYERTYAASPGRRPSPAQFAEDWLAAREAGDDNILQAYYDGLTHTSRDEAMRSLAAAAAAGIAKRLGIATGASRLRRLPNPLLENRWAGGEKADPDDLTISPAMAPHPAGRGLGGDWAETRRMLSEMPGRR